MSDSGVTSDEELLVGLKNNDGLLIRKLYKKFFGVILKFVVSNNGTEQDAKDIYQNSIIVLYGNCVKPEFRLNCQLQTYLFSIAKRLWLKQIGKDKKLIRLSHENSSEDYVDVSDAIKESEQRENELSRMEEKLQQLGEPCRALLTDFYYSRLTMEQIAEKFGYTNADNAKTQKYKCLQRLKKSFSREEE
jgi:RNA polymerase sigma factor (sigma-70 family)